jgi:hypothetical protein
MTLTVLPKPRLLGYPDLERACFVLLELAAAGGPDGSSNARVSALPFPKLMSWVRSPSPAPCRLPGIPVDRAVTPLAGRAVDLDCLSLIPSPTQNVTLRNY